MPILIVSSAANAAVAPSASTPPRAAPAARKRSRLIKDVFEPRRLRPPKQVAGNSTPPSGPECLSQRMCQANLQRFSGVGAVKESGGAEELIRGVIERRRARL